MSFFFGFFFVSFIFFFLHHLFFPLSPSPRLTIHLIPSLPMTNKQTTKRYRESSVDVKTTVLYHHHRISLHLMVQKCRVQVFRGWLGKGRKKDEKKEIIAWEHTIMQCCCRWKQEQQHQKLQQQQEHQKQLHQKLQQQWEHQQQPHHQKRSLEFPVPVWVPSPAGDGSGTPGRWPA